jgi:hypothetical protein
MSTNALSFAYGVTAGSISLAFSMGMVKDKLSKILDGTTYLSSSSKKKSD